MPTSPASEDRTSTTESASPPPTPAPTASSDTTAGRQNLSSLAAVGLIVSFFLPWINFLGARLNGMDIQKAFSSYRLVWIMPALALIALVANLAKQPAKSLSQLAGVSPFVILCYAAYRLKSNLSELLKLLEYGAWIALVCGLVLFFAPSDTKKPTIPA